MELDQHDARGILDAHHRVREALGRKSLTHAGRALQDDVLLGAQDTHGCVIAFLADVDLVKELPGGVLRENYQRFLVVNLVVAIFEERLNARKEFRVVGDLGEGLHCQSFVDWPVS